MKSTKLSVGLVTWNSLKFLPQILPALLAEAKQQRAQILIWDNASQDGTADYLTQNFPQLKLFRSPVNIGFAAAHNFLARTSQSEFYFCVNPDVLLEPGHLAELLLFLQTHPHAAAAQGKLLRWEDSLNPLLDSAGLEFLSSGKVVDRGQGQPLSGYHKLKKVDGCTGAAVLYRTQDFLTQGGFPPDFFAYKEDVFLSARFQSARLGQFYIPSAVGYHKRTIRPRAHKGAFEKYLSFRNHSLFLKSQPQSLLFCLREFLRFSYFFLYYSSWFKQVKRELKWKKL